MLTRKNKYHAQGTVNPIACWVCSMELHGITQLVGDINPSEKLSVTLVAQHLCFPSALSTPEAFAFHCKQVPAAHSV